MTALPALPRTARGTMEPTRTMHGVVEYRDIEGYDGYRVGSDGSIWSSRSGRWKPLKSSNCNGYRIVTLYTRGRDSKRSFKVHGLVLAAFVGDAPEGQVCRHLDGNRANNALTNLAWGTHQENSDDRFRHGTNLCGEKHPSAKLSDSQVDEIKRLAAGGVSQSSIAKRFGCNQQNVSRIVNGRRRPTCK